MRATRGSSDSGSPRHASHALAPTADSGPQRHGMIAHGRSAACRATRRLHHDCRGWRLSGAWPLVCVASRRCSGPTRALGNVKLGTRLLRYGVLGERDSTAPRPWRPSGCALTAHRRIVCRTPPTTPSPVATCSMAARSDHRHVLMAFLKRRLVHADGCGVHLAGSNPRCTARCMMPSTSSQLPHLLRHRRVFGSLDHQRLEQRLRGGFREPRLDLVRSHCTPASRQPNRAVLAGIPASAACRAGTPGSSAPHRRLPCGPPRLEPLHARQGAQNPRVQVLVTHRRPRAMAPSSTREDPFGMCRERRYGRPRHVARDGGTVLPHRFYQHQGCMIALYTA